MLETLLAYQVIFRTSVGELYQGELAQVEAVIHRRARGLRVRLERQGKGPAIRRRVEHLARIAGSGESA